MEVAVLLSGGIDSALTLALARESGGRVRALHVSYGQPAEAAEARAAERVAHRAGVALDLRRIPPLEALPDGEIPGRNALLALLALAWTPARPAALALGIHAGCSHYDTTPAFARDLERLLDGYTGGSVSLLTPLLTWTKAEIVAEARAWGVPLELTWSCERSSTEPCGACLSCLDREACHV